MSTSLHVVCPACAAVNRVPRERPAIAAKCGRCGQRLFQGQPVELDAAGFERHLGQSGLPLLVDFWAPWCGPCRAMAPVLAAAARELEPRLRLAKLDTDAVPEVAARYGIRSIPTLILFKDGREAARVGGALPAGQLRQWIERQLARVSAADRAKWQARWRSARASRAPRSRSWCGRRRPCPGRVLDVAAGDGRNALWLAARASP